MFTQAWPDTDAINVKIDLLPAVPQPSQYTITTLARTPHFPASLRFALSPAIRDRSSPDISQQFLTLSWIWLGVELLRENRFRADCSQGRFQSKANQTLNGNILSFNTKKTSLHFPVKIFICNQYGKDSQSYRWLKCNLFAFSSMSAEHLQKKIISYAFQQCKYFENRLRFDKVTESSKTGTFLRHSVYYSALKSQLGWFNLPHSPMRSLCVTAKQRVVKFQEMSMSNRQIAMEGTTFENRRVLRWWWKMPWEMSTTGPGSEHDGREQLGITLRKKYRLLKRLSSCSFTTFVP